MPLAHQRAKQRSACIKKNSIFYNFHVTLQQGDFYNGFAQFTFDLVEIPEELHIDFRGNPLKFYLNKQPVNLIHQQGFIVLDVSKLIKGTNHASILYRNKYNNDGNGCASFIDIDKKQYLYTHFQAYQANKVFPCFDQPDLKAKMKLSAIIPFTWNKIMSNQYPKLQEQFSKESYQNNVQCENKLLLEQYLNQAKQGKMFLFPQTKVLSTYLFCFVAGDYLQIKLQQPYKGIPMSVYSIRSLYNCLQRMAQFMFEITIQSLKFFEQFFGHQFSFNKYDQVFVHEFNMGAMQNAGIVTFNDHRIWKGDPSIDSKIILAATIAHQLSHHWFGNLVTMEWWDDLWLNQSFAVFISYLCLEKLKNKELKTIRYQSAMLGFLIRKNKGYNEDQRITTHPIRGKIPNTVVAQSSFDGITYQKGSGTMKQLMLIVGQERFSKALSNYFHKFAWKNATIDDFIFQLKQVKEEHLDLDKWKQLWLQTASLNVLSVFLNFQNTLQNAKLQIIQKPYTNEYPYIRPHKIKIALFKKDCTVDTLELLIQQEKTIIQYNGSNNYQAVLLNYQDHSFVKIVIDPISRKFFENNLNYIKDIFTRGFIWNNIFEGVKDATITSSTFVDIFIKNISYQNSEYIIQKQLENVQNVLYNYTPIKYREQLGEKLFMFIHDWLISILSNQSQSKKSEKIDLLKHHIIVFANTQKSREIIYKWGTRSYQPFQNCKILTWSIVFCIFKMNSLEQEQKQEMFEYYYNIDSSDRKKRAILQCNALKSNQQQFEQIYQSYKNPENPLTVAMKQSSAYGWNVTTHLQRLLKYKDRYFKDLQQVSKVLDDKHLQFFIFNLSPIDDDLQGNAKRYQQALHLFEEAKFGKIHILMRKKIQQLRKKAKAYQLFYEEKQKESKMIIQ